MNLKEVNKGIKKAISGEQKLNEGCGLIASELQEYFDNEISVLYQSSEGLVIVIEEGDWQKAPLNIPVSEAIKNIEEDKNHYKT